MLTNNANNDTDTTLTIAFFANNGVWKYMYNYAFSRKKFGKFNIVSYILEHCLVQFVLVLKKIRVVRLHVVLSVLFLNFCREAAYVIRFIKL